jgi:hypothetical protein
MFCLGLSLPTKWSNVTCFGITLICVPLHTWAKYLIWIGGLNKQNIRKYRLHYLGIYRDGVYDMYINLVCKNEYVVG